MARLASRARFPMVPARWATSAFAAILLGFSGLAMATVTGTFGASGSGESLRVDFECTGTPTCTGQYRLEERAQQCSNLLLHNGAITITGLNLAQSGPIQGSITLAGAETTITVLPNGTCVLVVTGSGSIPYTGTWNLATGTGTFTAVADVPFPGTFTSNPAAVPPIFPMTVTANIGPVVSNASAVIQYRPQDLGTVGSVFVFAVAPASMVAGAVPADPLRMKATSEGKDTPVQCVLAQLSSSGQLVAVSPSSMQAYITGVLTAQAQAVTILNGVPTVNIGGAVFYVGYGANANAMMNGGINRRALSVPGSLQCDPQPPQTGWWWNPLEDGRGYSVEVHGNNLFFASFLYDVTGRSSWYVATGPVSLDGSLFNNELLSARGGQALGAGYPGFPTLRNEGPITLAFSNASTGTLVWPGGTVPIQRFNIVPDGLNKPPVPNQPESGWWWNEAEAGRGFFLEWQGGILNIAGYMYDDAGNPVWYLTQNATPTTNAQSFSSNWWSFGNGMTLAGPWQPHRQVSGNVAPVTIQFQGSENAIMTLLNGRTTAIKRHRF